MHCGWNYGLFRRCWCGAGDPKSYQCCGRSAETVQVGPTAIRMLVGSQARLWARKNGHETAEEEEIDSFHLTDGNLLAWREYRVRLARSESEGQIMDFGHDTVGAIAMDKSGHMAAGVSSGGIALKTPGRVGEAAFSGIGCDATDGDELLPPHAFSISGTGEQIMHTRLGPRFQQRLQRTEADSVDILRESLSDFKSRVKGDIPPSAGLIAAVKRRDAVDIVWGHTTDSMGVGYISNTRTTPQVFISRRSRRYDPPDSIPCCGVVIPTAQESENSCDSDGDDFAERCD
eukprot:TRINITY_DN2936_c0_g1_i2.p1 TRINITY_DN2936_c0_g1~~TRINITY_DN2936_c0_g1_i2.p1  ORF type:complete len:288 (-),score=47.89 TRINITY_DN2936_c0_g1_i2:33-896(-)